MVSFLHKNIDVNRGQIFKPERIPCCGYYFGDYNFPKQMLKQRKSFTLPTMLINLNLEVTQESFVLKEPSHSEMGVQPRAAVLDQ